MFRFRLQRVLDLRARTERDAATALVSAQEAADVARDAQHQLQRTRAELASRLSAGMAVGGLTAGGLPASMADGDATPHSMIGALENTAPTGAHPTAPAPSVGALRNLSFLLDRLDASVAGAAAETAVAEQAVSTREDALRSAYRDRHTLDRLRDRHRDAWRVTEAAQDRAQMDEIALMRFAQQGSGLAGMPSTTHASDDT